MKTEAGEEMEDMAATTVLLVMLGESQDAHASILGDAKALSWFSTNDKG
jgi:hypothetical protein